MEFAIIFRAFWRMSSCARRASSCSALMIAFTSRRRATRLPIKRGSTPVWTVGDGNSASGVLPSSSWVGRVMVVKQMLYSCEREQPVPRGVGGGGKRRPGTGTSRWMWDEGEGGRR